MKKKYSIVFQIIGASLAVAALLLFSPQSFSGTGTRVLNEAEAATCGVTYYGPTTFPAGCYECNNGWTGCISEDTYGGASGVNCWLVSSCTQPDYSCTVQSGTFTYPYTYPAVTIPSGTYDITTPTWSGTQTYGAPGLSQGAYVPVPGYRVPGYYSGSRQGGGCSWNVTILPPSLSWYGTANGSQLSRGEDYVFDLRAAWGVAMNAIEYVGNRWGDGNYYDFTSTPLNAAADKIISSDTPVGTSGVGSFDCSNGCLGSIQWSPSGREWAGSSVGTPPLTNLPRGTYSRDIYMRDTNGVWSSVFYNTFKIVPTCTVPTIGGSFTAPYSFSFEIPEGNYWGSNASVSYSQTYLKADATVKYPNDVIDTIKNSFNQPFGAGHYVGNLNNLGDNSLCRWDFTVTQAPSYTHYTIGSWSDCAGYNVYTGEGGTQTRTVTPYTNTTAPNESQPDSSQSCSVGSYTHYTVGSWSACTGYNTSTGQGGTQTRTVTSYTNTTGPSDSAPASSQSCSVSSYTHYNISSWSACGGYNTSTGQGGSQTRTVSSYTDTTGPSDSEPSSSQSCSMPPDFNFLSAPGSGTLSNVYSTFVTFIGGQQTALSVPVMIAIDPTFPSYPTPANLAFSVTNVSPGLPAGVSYAFTPNPVSPSGYSQGTSFVVTVPVTNAGLYTLTVEASGGGIVKQATVYLNVNVANPTFQEI